VRGRSAGRRRPPRGPRASSGGRLSAPGDFVVTRLAGSAVLRRLQAEAEARGALAGTSFADAVPPDGSGPPVHWLETAEGGPALGAFLGSPPGLAALARLTGRRWEHRGGAGRYSYYRQPYHFQALHRDVLDCELSVITCLRDDPGPGGDLLLFPGRVDEPLAQVRATPGAGMVTLRLRPGESLVFFGRAVPHAVTPVGPGRARITVPACYRAVSPAGAARGT
jgi:hypothetical protein